MRRWDLKHFIIFRIFEIMASQITKFNPYGNNQSKHSSHDYLLSLNCDFNISSNRHFNAYNVRCFSCDCLVFHYLLCVNYKST